MGVTGIGGGDQTLVEHWTALLMSLDADSVTVQTFLPSPPVSHGLGGQDGKRLGEASNPGPQDCKWKYEYGNNDDGSGIKCKCMAKGNRIAYEMSETETLKSTMNLLSSSPTLSVFTNIRVRFRENSIRNTIQRAYRTSGLIY